MRYLVLFLILSAPFSLSACTNTLEGMARDWRHNVTAAGDLAQGRDPNQEHPQIERD